MSATPSKELTNKSVRAVQFGFYTDDEVGHVLCAAVCKLSRLPRCACCFIGACTEPAMLKTYGT